MKTITRAKYLDRIIELNGTPDIKIITGIRRSGKSKLMQAYIEYLKSHFENINIIFIDFMDLAYEEIKEYHALHAYVEEHYQEGKTNYLFVDEVQMCPKFELAINSLYSKGKYDIYVTSSNAFLLSADLATLFTGSYIEIHVFPFSFQEYCQYYDDISDKDKLFDEYAIKGGLAGSYAYRTEKDRTNYIEEVYKTIVTRDLVQKYALSDTLVLQRLSEFLMDNISNLASPNIGHEEVIDVNVTDVWDEKIFDPLPLAAEHTAQIRDRVAVFGADQHKNFSCHRLCRAVLGDRLDGVEELS